MFDVRGKVVAVTGSASGIGRGLAEEAARRGARVALADIDHSGKLMNATNLVIGGGLAIGPALAGQLIAANGGSLHVLLLLATLIAAIALALLLALQTRHRPHPHA